MSKNYDRTTEDWIDTWDVEWDFQAVQLADIDVRYSLTVQNRSAVKLDEEHVLNIMEWLDDPRHRVSPIVVNKVNDRFYIIDGNHRVKAAGENRRADIDAYVVTVPQDTFESMVLGANFRNAKGITPAERVELAQALALRIGTKAAAAQALMSPEVLQREGRVMDGRAKIKDALRVDATGWGKAKCEALNRLDVDQIKAIGNVLEAATKGEVESVVQNILAVPAAAQHEQAAKESGRLEQLQRDKKKPGSKRPTSTMTTNKMRTQVIQWTKFLKDNPSAFNDTSLMDALGDLFSVAEQKSRHAAA